MYTQISETVVGFPIDQCRDWDCDGSQGDWGCGRGGGVYSYRVPIVQISITGKQTKSRRGDIENLENECGPGKVIEKS